MKIGNVKKYKEKKKEIMYKHKIEEIDKSH